MDLEIFLHFVILCTCNEGHHFYLNDMQTNYVMKYLNDYNDNAKIIKKNCFWRVCLNLLFSWKCEHKCGLGDLLTLTHMIKSIISKNINTHHKLELSMKVNNPSFVIMFTVAISTMYGICTVQYGGYREPWENPIWRKHSGS